MREYREATYKGQHWRNNHIIIELHFALFPNRKFNGFDKHKSRSDHYYINDHFRQDGISFYHCALYFESGIANLPTCLLVQSQVGTDGDSIWVSEFNLFRFIHHIRQYEIENISNS